MVSSVWVRVAACFSSAALWCGIVGHAAAGPKEVFGSVDVAPGNAELLTLRFINGEGGMLLSRDGGKTFRLTCFGAVDGELQGKAVYAMTTLGDGSMCVGTGTGVWCSNADGCGWKAGTGIENQWVGDLVGDPIDGNVAYAVTGSSEMKNGVYKRDGASAAWKPLGMQLDSWFTRVHVVKHGEGRRIWVSGVENVMVTPPGGGAPRTDVKYFVRYSDDDAATWTSHDFGEVTDRGSLRLVAVDPTNADRIVVAVLRPNEGQADDLHYSDKRGEPGSFVKIGSVTELGGTAFLPDGTLLYSDNDQITPGLYKVAKLGEAPTKLDALKIGCLRYDAATKKLYGCADWRFGTIDPNTGALTETFSIEAADQLLECPDEPSMKEQCAGALQSPNFCDISHWPGSPLCMKNFGTMGFGGSGAAGSAGAAGAAPAAGSGGSGGSGQAGSVAAGAGGSGAAGTAPEEPKDDDGGCRSAGARRQHSSGLFLALGLVALAWFRARRRPA